MGVPHQSRARARLRQRHSFVASFGWICPVSAVGFVEECLDDLVFGDGFDDLTVDEDLAFAV